MRRLATPLLLFGTVLLSLFLSVRLGHVSFGTGEMFETLLGQGDPTRRQILLEIRLPRALLGVLVGGGLALAGSVFQALLRNPLAEPYILGISGGSAAAAVLVLALTSGVLLRGPQAPERVLPDAIRPTGPTAVAAEPATGLLVYELRSGTKLYFALTSSRTADDCPTE